MKQKASEHSTALLCTTSVISTTALNQMAPQPLYGIFLFTGEGTVQVDVGVYPFKGDTVLFTTPYQILQINTKNPMTLQAIRFHGDYYCIQYHKEEVACNGLLFNNIYTAPLVFLDSPGYQEITGLLQKLSQELSFTDPYSISIAQTYLQLILAICSKAKIQAAPLISTTRPNHPATQFKLLLEQHFRQERTPAFYASQLGIAVNTLSKQTKAHYLKSPTELIQQRVVLEAKKLIHLTLKSIKEVAHELNFEDQHYFSRYFKKSTGISPIAFRENVGISKVAYSSI